jgi:hypothetical protein
MKTASQEREDEYTNLEEDYHLGQMSTPDPTLRQGATLGERLFLWGLGALGLLMLWIVLRGSYLAVRELIRWL